MTLFVIRITAPRYQALESIKQMVKTYIHYNIVYNSSLHHAIHALKSIAHMVKTYIHYNIVYNSSLQHALQRVNSMLQ